MKAARKIDEVMPSHRIEATAEGYLPHDLTRLMNALDMQLLEHIRPLNFTPQKYQVLQIVAELEPISIGDISRTAVVEQSVVSRMIDQLKDRKLVSKAKRPGNGRVVEVRLTSAGREIADEIQPIASYIVDRATEVLTARERNELVKTLSKIYNNVVSK